MREALALGWAFAFTGMVLESALAPQWSARKSAKWLAKVLGGRPEDHYDAALRNLHEAMPRRVLFAAAGWVVVFALRGGA